MATPKPTWFTAPAIPEPPASSPATCSQTDMAANSRPAPRPTAPRPRRTRGESVGTATAATDWADMETSSVRRWQVHRPLGASSDGPDTGRERGPDPAGGSSRTGGNRSLPPDRGADHDERMSSVDTGERGRLAVLPAVVALADAVLLLFAVGIWLTRQVPFADLTQAYLLGD